MDLVKITRQTGERNNITFCHSAPGTNNALTRLEFIKIHATGLGWKGAHEDSCNNGIIIKKPDDNTAFSSHHSSTKIR
jgi:hypothetical protein